MARVSVTRELLASREDVWAFIAEPHHFPTIAVLKVEAPWLIGVGRTLPRRALARLHALCQTGAES